MLRITKQAERERTVLRIEGKLVAPWIQELENCWQACRQSGSDAPQSLVVDLRSVTFVSSEGKELLSRIHRAGAKFVTSGTWMNSVVEELQINSERKSE